MIPFSDYLKSAAYILDHIEGRQPHIGIVLGTGLGSLADHIEDPIVLEYKDIPGFSTSTSVGHKGNLICGTVAGKCVLAMQGRLHYYESGDMDKATYPIRVMKPMGIDTLLLSNAAGGLNPEYRIGDLMIIRDQVNMLPNPLIGPNIDTFGQRFPDMTRPYDPSLIRKAHEIAQTLGIEVKEGVYCGDTGPTYETPAEYKYLRIAGGDVAGMSTVPEVIVARHCSIRVFGMSVVTNVSADILDDNYINDGDDVVQAAGSATERMTKIFTELIRTL